MSTETTSNASSIKAAWVHADRVQILLLIVCGLGLLGVVASAATAGDWFIVTLAVGVASLVAFYLMTMTLVHILRMLAVVADHTATRR